MKHSPSAESVRQLHRLTEVSRALTWSTSLDHVLELAADSCVALLDCARVVVLLDDEEGVLRAAATRGIEDAAAAAFEGRLDERIARSLEDLFGDGYEGRFLGAPIVVRGRIRGLLAVDRGVPCGTGEQEEWLLSALADQTALAIEVARDEKARLALEARIDAMERSRSDTERALKIAGHDLRTPLNSIQGYLELLASGVFGPVEDRQVEVVHRIQQIGQHLNSVLENVLEMARLASPSGEVELTAIDVSAVATDAVAMVEPRAAAKGLRTLVGVEPGLTLSGVPDRLRQVLLHLLDNAVKYAPSGTAIAVRASRLDDDPGWAEVIVSDEGPGIPPEHTERIFEPGHRIGGGGDPGGTGLGLSIARGLVREMGGDLRLRPEPGSGAHFEIRLRTVTAV